MCNWRANSKPGLALCAGAEMQTWRVTPQRLLTRAGFDRVSAARRLTPLSRQSHKNEIWGGGGG